MISKAQIGDFAVTVLQWYVAIILLVYGSAKLIGEQFGISHGEMLKPITQIDRFHIMFYLFGSTRIFRPCIGLIQVFGGILLLIPRTKLIGALVLLPVLLTIFLLDLCFSSETFGCSLIFTIFALVIADLIILYHSRAEILEALKALTVDQPTRMTYSWWIYLLLPILALLINYYVPRLIWLI